jgi:hypothetical protein
MIYTAKRLGGMIVIGCALVLGGVVLVHGPRLIVKAVSAPKSGAKRTPTKKEIDRVQEIWKKRKQDDGGLTRQSDARPRVLSSELE